MKDSSCEAQRKLSVFERSERLCEGISFLKQYLNELLKYDLDPKHFTLDNNTIVESNWNLFISLFCDLISLFPDKSVTTALNRWDDPLKLYNQIYIYLKSAGIGMEFTFNDIKTGSGRVVVEILYFLVNEIVCIHYTFEKPAVLELTEQLCNISQTSLSCSTELDSDTVESVDSHSDKEDAIEDPFCLQVSHESFKSKVEIEKLTPFIRERMRSIQVLQNVAWKASLNKGKKATASLLLFFNSAKPISISLLTSVKQDMSRIQTLELSLSKVFRYYAAKRASIYEHVGSDVSALTFLTTEVSLLLTQWEAQLVNYAAQNTEIEKSSNRITDTRPLLELKASIQKISKEIKYLSLQEKLLYIQLS